MAPLSHFRSELNLASSKLERFLHRAIEPTRTLLSSPTLVQRQATGTVTVTSAPSGSGSNNDGPTSAQTLSGGAIAGIVIGSIVGFLLLVWIFRSCSNLGAPPGAAENPGGNAWYDGVRDEYPPHHVSAQRHGGGPRSRSRNSHHSHHHHHRRSGSEVREVREVRPVAVVRSRSPRAPPYVYEPEVPGRGRRDRRARNRGDY